jgi:hypothetical protein
MGAEHELVIAMRNIDPDYLDQLRANAEAVRADLEEREANDPQLHVPEIVHKTNMDARRVLLSDDGDTNGDDDVPPPLTDEQMDIIAQVLAQMRMDFQAAIEDATAPLRERIATLEGQISILTSLLSDSGKSIEASETVRKLHVR